MLALGGERADAGLDHAHAAGAQRRDVGLRRRVLLHRVVHRRGDDHGAAGGEARRS